MARSTLSRPTGPQVGAKIGLIMTTALASVALSGCMTSAAPPAETSFNKAQVALEKGQVDKAILHAEAAVLADPRNPGFRAMLGAAYLEAGRFDSAATSFNDALDLGNEDPRTVLSYALAKVATGDNTAAVAALDEFGGVINPADLGLALALAGKPERGVHVLVNAVRNGDVSPKARQNLAYTYALAGNWRAARVMAAEDVPADQLDGRLTDWAASSRPEDFQVRVANLLQVTPSNDGGQPGHLSLSNFPSQPQMVAEAKTQAETNVAAAPAIDTVPNVAEKLAIGPNGVESSKPAPTRVAQAATAPKPVAKPTPVAKPKPAAPRFVSNPVVQKVPAAKPEAKKTPARVAKKTTQRRMAVATGTAATHLVQLGSYDSRDVAKSKWNELQRKFPQLKGHDVVITKAEVKGKTFFRVAAAGFGKSTAAQMCRTVKSSGRGCFAYAASNPPAGAVDRGVRIAAR